MVALPELSSLYCFLVMSDCGVPRGLFLATRSDLQKAILLSWCTHFPALRYGYTKTVALSSISTTAFKPTAQLCVRANVPSL